MPPFFASIGRASLFAAATMGFAMTCGSATAADPFRFLAPAAGRAPFPTVLLVSGCSGFVPVNGVNMYDQRAAELRAAGHGIVYVDYLGRRNLADCAGKISLSQVGRDIREAADWARSRPGVDPKRVTAIGWSYGGGGLLSLLAEAGTGASPVSKAVLFYPVCSEAAAWRATGVSVQMHLAGLDDVAPAAKCAPAISGAPAGVVQAVTYPAARRMRGVPRFRLNVVP